MYYYQIYIENNKNIYIYKSEEKYKIGEWCIINFVNKVKMGLIISEIEEDKISFDINKVKKIIEKADILSIPLSIMELIIWMKDYYISDYYNIIKTIYPGVLKLKYSKKAIYINDLEDKSKNKNMKLFNINNLNEKENSIKIFNEYMKKKKEVTVTTLQKNFSLDIIKRAIKEKSILIEKKIIKKKKNNSIKKLNNEIIDKKIQLNDEQKKVVEKIKESDKSLFLLKGVTGSGKTEIYINLIEEALKKNEGSIFLVPEISLTTQMIERLKTQFSDSIAILHSKLSLAEKKEEWTYIRNGDKKIVIGARSAIFAPIQNLKYIIIDEEHENTYKQENNPRYHIKNVAIKRSLIEKNTKVIFGSATPSFETYYQAKEGNLELLELKERYNNAKIPKYEVIDLNETTSNFSEKMLEKISEKLLKNEQIILILNRKAFSSLLKCKSCEYVPSCPNCSISLSYYKYENKLKCNYCGYEKKYDKKCSSCGEEKLIKLGSGTEKIEEELKDIFRTAKIIRIDSESVKTKEDYEAIYNDFKNHKYDIMLGTQIIAKGFHFPNVTLVGIVNSDIILNFPDFRAGEKTFQLLTQSAGRAGRGEKEGLVLIQTLNKENEVIKKTIENNYEGYYEEEMKMRKLFNYPPFGRLINIIISSEKEQELEEKVEIFYEKLIFEVEKYVKLEKKEIVSKPFKAPIYKIIGRYRYQIFIKLDIKNVVKIKNCIKKVMNNYNEKNIRISIDVDPLNMM